jgi:hypothetical protein
MNTKPDLLYVLIYSVGWLLFVAAQAQNSVRSSTNGLAGWPGFLHWLKLQAVNLLTRAVSCAVLYGTIVNSVTTKIQAVGLPFTGMAIAFFGGYAANTLLYQFFGLLPWLRVEVSDLAPPSSAPPAPPAPPTPPPSETRS